MADSDDIDTTIDTLLDNPSSVTSQSGSVTNLRIPDVIAADKHIAQKSLKASPFAALHRATLRGPSHYGT
jgi:hypothetical protein